MSATSRDIARLAGVSQATVSRVLADKPNVNPETRERVQRVLDETGFVPNEQARAMRTRRTGNLGVMTGKLANPFYPQLVASLAQAIDGAGHRMTLWSSDQTAGEEAVAAAIGGGTIDGVILTTPTEDSPALRAALERDVPVVLVNRSIDSVRCDQVSSDNVAATRHLARYFWAHGHRRVAIIGGDERISTGRERRVSFIDEIDALGGTIPEDWRTACGYEHDAAKAAALKVLSGPERPTAICAINDVVAFGVLDAATSLGIEVPAELWVTGFDDVPMATWDRFDLTTMGQPIRDMAEDAVQLLLRRIDGDRRPYVHQKHPAPFSIRGSTAHAPDIAN